MGLTFIELHRKTGLTLQKLRAIADAVNSIVAPQPIQVGVGNGVHSFNSM